MAHKVAKDPFEYTPSPGFQSMAAPDLIDQLHYEHRQITWLWNELQRAHRYEAGMSGARDASRLGDDTSQEEFLYLLLEALTNHEALEREVLYPAARPVMGDDWAEHAEAEHAQVDALLDEVAGGHPGDPAVFMVLSNAFSRLLAHIDEETTILFPVLRLVVPKGELVNPHRPDYEPAGARLRKAYDAPRRTQYEIAPTPAWVAELSPPDGAHANALGPAPTPAHAEADDEVDEVEAEVEVEEPAEVIDLAAAEQEGAGEPMDEVAGGDRAGGDGDGNGSEAVNGNGNGDRHKDRRRRRLLRR